MGEEPGLTVKTETEKVENIVVFSKDTTQKVVGYLTACPNGLKEYSRKVAGATETSLNLGVVSMKENGVEAAFLIRSAVDSRKQQVLERSRGCDKSIRRKRFAFQRISGMAVQATVRTPSGHGRSIQRSLWKRAGDLHYPRWTGVWNLPRKRPDLDCVSCGPDVLDIHSYNERLDIASTQRSWEFLKLVLEKL